MHGIQWIHDSLVIYMCLQLAVGTESYSNIFRFNYETKSVNNRSWLLNSSVKMSFIYLINRHDNIQETLTVYMLSGINSPAFHTITQNYCNTLQMFPKQFIHSLSPSCLSSSWNSKVQVLLLPSASVWITSTNCASVRSNLSFGSTPVNKGPAGSRPTWK